MHVGASAVDPVVDVMHIAVLWAGATAGGPAMSVSGDDGPPLGGGGGAHLATHVEHLALGHHDPLDDGIAGEQRGGGGVEVGAVERDRVARETPIETVGEPGSLGR